MTALITGCALLRSWDQACCWGDLHRVGTSYVFNACLEANGQAAWQYETPVPAHLKTITAIRQREADYFECRGVIVLGPSAVLNKQAKDYIG